VCLGVDPLLVLMTDVWYFLVVIVVPLWGALSEEKSGLSFVSQSAAFSRLSYVHKYLHCICLTYSRVYTICTRSLSAQAQYSKLCSISSSHNCGSLDS
jgi:hypothetical protein